MRTTGPAAPLRGGALQLNQSRPLPLRWSEISLRDTGRLLWAPRVFRASLRVFPLWFVANGLYNISLGCTTVTSNTVLSSTSAVFTFGIALALRQEFFSWWKAAGVVLSMGGAALTAVSDSMGSSSGSPGAMHPSPYCPSVTRGEGGGSWVLGDAICLVSAIFYGLYTTATARYLPSEETTTAMLFFGYIGLLGLVLLSPLVLVLDATGVEAVAVLSSGALGLIALKGIFDNVLSDLLWAVALKMTSPTVATLCLPLTIPLSMLLDWVFRSIVPSGFSASGATCMVLGFVAVNIGGSRADGAGLERRRATVVRSHVQQCTTHGGKKNAGNA